MHLVIRRVEEHEVVEMRRILEAVLGAPTWEDFKESIYALHRQIFASTKNKFLEQVMALILDDRRAVLFDGRDTDKPAPDLVRQQTHRELRAIVDAIADRNAKRAEKLVSDHLLRTLATINIWQ
jgi:DNA-binding FadR family transcriptional regulator